MISAYSHAPVGPGGYMMQGAMPPHFAGHAALGLKAMQNSSWQQPAQRAFAPSANFGGGWQHPPGPDQLSNLYNRPPGSPIPGLEHLFQGSFPSNEPQYFVSNPPLQAHPPAQIHQPMRNFEHDGVTPHRQFPKHNMEHAGIINREQMPAEQRPQAGPKVQDKSVSITKQWEDDEKQRSKRTEREDLQAVWKEQIEERQRIKQQEAARIKQREMEEAERVRREQDELRAQFEMDAAKKKAASNKGMGNVPPRTPPSSPPRRMAADSSSSTTMMMGRGAALDNEGAGAKGGKGKAASLLSEEEYKAELAKQMEEKQRRKREEEDRERDKQEREERRLARQQQELRAQAQSEAPPANNSGAAPARKGALPRTPPAAASSVGLGGRHVESEDVRDSRGVHGAARGSYESVHHPAGVAAASYGYAAQTSPVMHHRLHQQAPPHITVVSADDQGEAAHARGAAMHHEAAAAHVGYSEEQRQHMLQWQKDFEMYAASPVASQAINNNIENNSPQKPAWDKPVSARNKMPLSKALAAARNGNIKDVPHRRAQASPPVVASKGVPSASELRAQARASRQATAAGANGNNDGWKRAPPQGGAKQGPVFGRRAVLAQPEAARPRAGPRGNVGDQLLKRSLNSESMFLTAGQNILAIFGEPNAGASYDEAPHQDAVRSANSADNYKSRYNPLVGAGRPGTEPVSDARGADGMYYNGRRMNIAAENRVESLGAAAGGLAPQERDNLDGFLHAFVQGGR